jgi:hypothetical protein
VQRILEERAARGRKRHDWGISPLGNRILYSVLIAVALNWFTFSGAGGLMGWWLGGIFFLATTVIVAIRRR